MPKFKYARPARFHFNGTDRRFSDPVLCVSSDERTTPTSYYFVGEHFGTTACENQEHSIQTPGHEWPTTFEWVDATDTHRALAEKHGIALEASK